MVSSYDLVCWCWCPRDGLPCALPSAGLAWAPGLSTTTRHSYRRTWASLRHPSPAEHWRPGPVGTLTPPLSLCPDPCHAPHWPLCGPFSTAMCMPFRAPQVRTAVPTPRPSPSHPPWWLGRPPSLWTWSLWPTVSGMAPNALPPSRCAGCHLVCNPLGPGAIPAHLFFISFLFWSDFRLTGRLQS